MVFSRNDRVAPRHGNDSRARFKSVNKHAAMKVHHLAAFRHRVMLTIYVNDNLLNWLSLYIRNEPSLFSVIHKLISKHIGYIPTQNCENNLKNHSNVNVGKNRLK